MSRTNKTFWNIANRAKISNSTIDTIILTRKGDIDDYGGAYSARIDFLIAGFAAKIKIGIQRDLLQYQQIAMLYHELGHADCHKRKCRCFTPAKQNRKLSEIHAHKYTLEHLLKDGYHKALKWYINQVVKMPTESDNCLYVRQAALTVIKSKLFEECQQV